MSGISEGETGTGDEQSGKAPASGGKSKDDAESKTFGAGNSASGDSFSVEGYSNKALLDRYLQQLAKKINKTKRYPRQARRKHWEGTVLVEIEILPSGEIDHITLRKKSQYTTLDNAALKAFEDAQPFPAFPEGLDSPSIKLTIPIQFTLK